MPKLRLSVTALVLGLAVAGVSFAVGIGGPPAVADTATDATSCCVTGDCCCPAAGSCCDTSKRATAADAMTFVKTASCCATGNCCCPGAGSCCAGADAEKSCCEK